MAFEFAGSTDVGRKREHNEDSLLVLPARELIVVADGMGGHNAGEVASDIAVKTIEWFFNSVAADPYADVAVPDGPALRRGCESTAGRHPVGEQPHSGSSPRGRQAGHGHHRCGSPPGGRTRLRGLGGRQPRLRLSERRAASTDRRFHSLQNELLRTGRIRPEEVAGFQHKNVITRALGIAEKAEVDMEQVDLALDECHPPLLRRPHHHGGGSADCQCPGRAA